VTPVWVVALALAATDLLTAQSVSSIAEAEVARRSRLVAEAPLQLQEASVLLEAGKTAESLEIYRAVYESLPDVVMAASVRNSAREGFAITGVQRARELAAEGRYPDARAILEEILSEGVDPKNADAKTFQRELADPDRWPPALTAEHIANVNEVSELLLMAHSAREIGDLDRSASLYQKALRIDPYNSAARRGMEKVEQHRGEYFAAARDQTRSKMLNEVNQIWEDPLPPMDLSNLFGGSDDLYARERGGREDLINKLQTLQLSRIDLSGASLDETIEYLRVRSRDLDPTGKGVDFVVSLPEDVRARQTSLNLVDVPLDEVLRYVTEDAGATYRVEEHAVRIISLSEDSSAIISKVYRVPPDFIQSTPMESGAGDDPFGSTTSNSTAGLDIRRMSAKEFLESRGVVFADGAGASFNARTNTLVVRNTPAQLRTVEMLVDQSAAASPKVVQLEFRVMQVAEATLKEIGYDWLLGPFNLNSSNMAGNGGTIGNQNLAGNFALSQFVPSPFVPILGNPVTAGLRSSNDLTSSNTNIDAVISGGTQPSQNRSPGALSISGVFTQPQFQMVLRALDQKKGTDVMAAPSIVAKNGQAVSVRGVREMLYPTEFDPPQVPQGNQNVNAIVAIFTFNIPGDTPPLVVVPGGPIPIPNGTYQLVNPREPAPTVSPATPTAFEQREVGTLLDAEPVISEDGKSIELNLSLEHSDFDGFIDYGSPFVTQDTLFDDSVIIFPFIFAFNGPNRRSVQNLQANTITQPVFSVKKTNTSVKIWDGSTLVLAGLQKDENTEIEDKIPILGDIPYAGRLFSTKITEKRRSHMLMFVTAKVLDPSGKRLHQTAATAP
jgi:general secretion pathway protein D